MKALFVYVVFTPFGLPANTSIANRHRVFQQRRLLEGQSTANIATLTALIVKAEESGDQRLRAATIIKRDGNHGDKSD